MLKVKSCAVVLLELWSKSPSGSFTEQLLFLHSFEWLLLIIYLISAIKNSAHEKSNNNPLHHIREENLKQLGL